MKNLHLLFFALFLGCFAPVLSYSQGVRYDIPPILTANGKPVSAPVISLCPGTATISGTACSPATGQSTTDITNNTLCPIGSPVTLTGLNTCQATGDTLGNAGFWLKPGAYIYCITASGITGACYNLTVPVGNTAAGVATITGALTAQSIGGVQYAATYAGSSTTCGITEAINALPNKRGKVILQNGNCSASGWPVTITTQVVIEGQGMGGPTDAGTNAAVTAGSSLTNTSTGSGFFVIQLPGGGNSLEGVTLRDFAMIGNKTIGGATGGDCIDFSGGASSTQLRMIRLQNLQCNQPKGVGISVQGNDFELTLDHVQVQQSGSHCMTISDNGLGGTISQVHFISSTLDLCGGNNASSSPGSADGLNIQGSGARGIDAVDSTFADSNNGINVVTGATNTQLHITHDDFETNTTCDVNINDGYGHIITGSTLLGTSVGARGICSTPPAGAGFALTQLLVYGNNISGHVTQDITIGASQHLCFILPQANSNYTFSDASLTCVVLTSNSAGALVVTAFGGITPNSAANGSIGSNLLPWNNAYLFGFWRITEGASPGVSPGGTDLCYADSTAHAVQCSYNGGAVSKVPLVGIANTFTAAQTIGSGGSLNATNLLLSPTAPTIAAAGCGGSAAAMVANNGTAAFEVNVGTAPTSGGCTITMPSAATGWNCDCSDLTTTSTTVFYCKQTGAVSQTSVVLQNFSDVAAATAFTASDHLRVKCMAY